MLINLDLSWHARTWHARNPTSLVFGHQSADHDGSAVIINNVMCIHEEDVGLLWKHTDYRVGGRSYSVRSRRLVISMVCAVANYGTTCCYLATFSFL